jgi:predicted amidohydrolase
MSSSGPREIGPADWTRVAWEVLREELEATAALAGELQLWTVLGSTHRLSAPHRPHNSLYVLSGRGGVRTRYDERYLSHTKTTFMYSPGRQPITFEVDGWRFGCALGLECHFPEVFGDYERRDVDCVLFSSTGDGTGDAATFAVECQGHAATNGYWLSFSVPPQHDPSATSGVIAPSGRWLRRCPPTDEPAAVVVDLGEHSDDITTAVSMARPWRRRARQGFYDAHVVDDARSDERASF